MQILDELKNILGNALLDEREAASGQHYFQVFSEKLPDAVEKVSRSGNWRFLFLTAVRQKDSLRLLYGFSAGSIMMVLECSLEGGCASFPSITPIIPSASLFEEEIAATLGLTFSGHLGFSPKAAGEAEGEIVLSPQAILPSLVEPAGFSIVLTNEKVRLFRWEGFFIRRGIERLGEEALDYGALPFAAERICALAGFSHSTAFCRAVEAAIALEAPPRARAVRTILLELERIKSHLLWLGLAGRIAGFETFFMQAFRMREPLMWLSESLCGNRMNCGLNRVGGLESDIRPEGLSELVITLEELEHDLERFTRAFSQDLLFRKKFKNCGTLSREDALRLGAVGAVARASGMEFSGDAPARFFVRLAEISESIGLIHSVLTAMPEGPIFSPAGAIQPGREGFGLAEGPEGEVIHYVRTGEKNRPASWRVRSPEIMNLQAAATALPGTSREDLPTALWSFNPCFSCLER
ncbi:MAG: NADH-quinone oxidoreductase subunit C [bacterium]